MIIYNKVVFVYDVEAFPNLFTCALLNTNSNKVGVYEISNRKNDLGKIISTFLNKGIIFCGYNNKYYDDPIINYIILNQQILLQALPKVGVEEHHEENVRMQKMWEENKIVDKLQKK